MDSARHGEPPQVLELYDVSTPALGFHRVLCIVLRVVIAHTTRRWA